MVSSFRREGSSGLGDSANTYHLREHELGCTAPFSGDHVYQPRAFPTNSSRSIRAQVMTFTSASDISQALQQ